MSRSHSLMSSMSGAFEVPAPRESRYSWVISVSSISSAHSAMRVVYMLRREKSTSWRNITPTRCEDALPYSGSV